MKQGGELIVELKDRQDIHDVLVRYCRGADRCDADIIKSCYHDGAWDNHGFFNGLADEFADHAAKNLRERFISCKHHMTNSTIMVRGDRAKSECYILAVCRMENESGRFDVTVSARYLDHFERRNGKWKIVHRVLVSDGTRVDAVVQEAPQLDVGEKGARGGDDPSYAFFAGLDEVADTV